MKDKSPTDGAHESMLPEGKKARVVEPKPKPKTTQAQDEEYEALQSFLRSISSTATLPPYVKGETYSSTRGVLNQCIITCAVLILAAGAGHPIGYSSVALPQLRNDTELMIDDDMGSWIASIHSAATPVGSMLSGPIMEAIGRKRTLQASTLPLVLGWILIGTANSHALILIGRFVCGFAVGIMAAPSQVYLGEISEPRLRGLLIGTPFVAYSLGVLYVYALGGSMHWRTVSYMCIVLPVLAFLALCFSPESPTWLAGRDRFLEAKAAMTRLRGDADTAERELRDLLAAREKEKARGDEKITFLTAITRSAVLKPLLLINAFNILQILSGTYIVIFYAQDIFKTIGGDVDDKTGATASAITRMAVTVVSCFLLLKITRRALVMISGVGSAACTLSLTYLLYSGQATGAIPAILVLGYVGFNTLGFFLLPGIMVGELLPTKIRGLCGGYIFCVLNILLFAFTKAFPLIVKSLTITGTFGLFGASAALATLVLFLMFPETKGRSLIQIEQYYQKPNILWLTRQKNSFANPQV